LRCVVWYTFTDVSEVLAASIIIISVMMKAASISETSVYFYQTTQRNNPEDSHLVNPLFLIYWAEQLTELKMIPGKRSEAFCTTLGRH
jgi:hypothetical protein